MIQSGILYTIDSTTGQATNKPLKGAWINFVQNDVIKVRTQTHGETGAYSVDVPLGKYTVNLAVGNVTVTMRAGQLFELKSGDNASAFQNWLYSTTADVDDTLLNSFKQIANDISDSANRAENAATEAQQIQQQMQNNSVGDADGKWLKEGAFGLAASKAEKVGNISDFTKALARSGIYQIFYNMGTFNYGCALNLNYSSSHKTMFGVGSVSRATPDFLADHYINGSLASSSLFYTSGNTKRDKNNVLHATTGTPKDTLLVGDYGFGGNVVQVTNGNPWEQHGKQSMLIMNNTKNDLTISSYGIYLTPLNKGFHSVLSWHHSDASKINLYITNGSKTQTVDIYNSGNTTIDSNGFIKKASPIIKLFDDHIEWNQDFKEDPIFEKISPGIYKISNTHGLAREGWTYEKPRGKDGNTYFKIKVQKLDDGCIISVHDYFVDYEDITIIDDVGNKRTVKKQIEVLSQARDIKPEERWIDLRFFEKIYDLTNEPPKINIPYHPLWGIEPYIPPAPEQIEEDIALENQRAF